MRLSGGRKYSFLFWGLLLVLLSVSTRTAESPSHFEQANRLYEQGKFSQAASLYESMVKAGRHSPAVFFNLGNAYFKSEELGRAVFNYRRAARLAPRDPDIQANLRFTRDRIHGGVSVTPPLWQRPLLYFTLNELTTACAFLFWIWAALICLSRFRLSLKTKLRASEVVVGSLLVAMLILLGFAYMISHDELAIVTVPQATVHLGPLSESQSAFNTADGTELNLLARRDDWLQVSDRSERSGWIPATNVLVFPPGH